MTKEDMQKLNELVLDYDFKVMDREQARREHQDYMESNDYKFGSDESAEFGNKELNACFEVVRAAERLAKFVSEKIKEIK